MTDNQIAVSNLPLVDRIPGDLIPGAVSLPKYALANGAALLGAEPLSIEMPQQQWAYGVVFPLDHTALSGRLGNASCVAYVNLVVEGGIVGVAASSADGSKFVVPETVASGDTEVRMALSRPRRDRAVILRNVEAPKSVRVTIREIGISAAGEERLAPRGHDLDYDLFVILSPSKTGTQRLSTRCTRSRRLRGYIARIMPLSKARRGIWPSPQPQPALSA
jgi:hypothetical protein